MSKTKARSMRYDAAARRLTITVGKETEAYTVEPVRDEAGREVLGHRLHKLSEEGVNYDVQPAGDRCECMGWLRWGRCKHVDAVCKLISLKLVEACG